MRTIILSLLTFLLLAGLIGAASGNLSKRAADDSDLSDTAGAELPEVDDPEVKVSDEDEADETPVVDEPVVEVSTEEDDAAAVSAEDVEEEAPEVDEPVVEVAPAEENAEIKLGAEDDITTEIPDLAETGWEDVEVSSEVTDEEDDSEKPTRPTGEESDEELSDDRTDEEVTDEEDDSEKPTRPTVEEEEEVEIPDEEKGDPDITADKISEEEEEEVRATMETLPPMAPEEEDEIATEIPNVEETGWEELPTADQEDEEDDSEKPTRPTVEEEEEIEIPDEEKGDPDITADKISEEEEEEVRVTLETLPPMAPEDEEEISTEIPNLEETPVVDKPVVQVSVVEEDKAAESAEDVEEEAPEVDEPVVEVAPATDVAEVKLAAEDEEEITTENPDLAETDEEDDSEEPTESTEEESEEEGEVDEEVNDDVEEEEEEEVVEEEGDVDEEVNDDVEDVEEEEEEEIVEEEEEEIVEEEEEEEINAEQSEEEFVSEDDEVLAEEWEDIFRENETVLMAETTETNLTEIDAVISGKSADVELGVIEVFPDELIEMESNVTEVEIVDDLGSSEADASDGDESGDCIEAWAKLGAQSDENGCVGADVIDAFAANCGIPELKDRIVELKSKCGAGEPMRFLSVSTEQARTSKQSRHKRFVLAGSRTWTGAKVPFIDGTSQSVRRAMNTIERYTCIRFYPWSNENGVTTNDQLGLDHQSYLKFVYEGGCWADHGNLRNANGQKVSCCGGITCLHEIGHALGAYHEHQNPLGKGVIRLNPENAESSKIHNFRETDNPNTFSAGFDMQSVMAYGRTTFSNGNGEVISYEFSDVGGGSDWYYLMYEISKTHKCAELYCSDVQMECVNDGYMTLVDGVCGCMCPPGLDPTTGCAETLKDTESEVTPATSVWPAGQYAIPRVSEGCPDGFSEGTITEVGSAGGKCVNKNRRGCRHWKRVYGCEGNPGFMNKMCPVTCNVCHFMGNHVSEPYHLAGSVSGSSVEHAVCTKDSVAGDNEVVQWPAGQYCIYKKGECPEGFDSGSAVFKDDGASSSSGSVPDGDFSSSSTKWEFCCNKYGFERDELTFPRTKPFALLMSADVSNCHRVRGMHAYEGYTVVKNSGGGGPTLTGDTPVRVLDSEKNTWKIPYCYYAPAAKANCGGAITLTDDNPTVTLEGGSGKDQQCIWLVKGDSEGSRVVLKFEEMNVAKNDKGCVDKVVVNYNRPGQTGKLYCGDRLQKSISTVGNILEVNYDTFASGDSSFKATASLISQNNLCYSLADKGRSYTGTVSRTRGMKTCIPWAQAAHCPFNPFRDGDINDNLVDNYCRNPDPNGLRPWCYTKAEGCQRDYCDVCLFEEPFDTATYQNCEVMAQNGFCENDPKVQERCAATCIDQIASFPEATLAKDTTCGAPDPVADGVITGGEKASYSVGDVLIYQCSDSSTPSETERICQSDGTWSSLNLVCTECPLGWFFKNGNCYILHKEDVTHGEAVAKCNEGGATLAMAKTADEMDFLSGISFWYGSWLAASDSAEEGTWMWDDGTPATWTRWMRGQPDNYYNEDCVWMTQSGEMEDRWCQSDRYSYICMKPANAVTSCDDVTDDCANFYANDATSCTSQENCMQRICKKTCGLCSPASCSVEDAPANAQKSADTDVSSINQGGVVTYECVPGYKAVGGDANRGCKADGSMTGQPLECAPDNEVATSDVELDKLGQWGNRYGHGNAFTGDLDGLVIPKSGKITKWEFFSTDLSTVVFQVWRPTGNPNKMELVGQNQVNTPDDIASTAYVAEGDQIEVQEGDYIGVYYPESTTPVGYTVCDGTSPIKVLKRPNKNNNFSPGNQYDFKDENKQKCRIYRFRAIVV